jgi:enamidase
LWDYFRDFARRRGLAIENGVTTIRSAGDNYPHITQLRDKIESGRLTGPRILAAGPIFTAPGGHPAGTIYRRNRYIVEHATRQVGDRDTAREEVRRLAEEGVDCIKAVYSKINAMDLSHEVPRLALDVLEAIVGEAHDHNLPVMVHTGSADETKEAVMAGTDSIEHGLLPGTDTTRFDDSVARAMVDRGTCYVPTLAMAWSYRDTYPDLFSSLLKAVRTLHGAGVRIAAGTDSGAPGVVIGRALHKELEVMVEAGMSPMDAIVAATRNAAVNVGRGGELGTIEEGRLADIIVVSGDPLEDIRHTRGVVMVIRDGRVLVNKLGQSGRAR